MRIERYTARDSRSAMAQVRAELGADALILANRRVGGQIEITAALDVEQAVASAYTPGAAPERDAPVAAAGNRRPGNEIQLKALENELQRLRGILEQELGTRSWRDVAGHQAPITALRQRLLRLGLSRTLSGSIIDQLPPAMRLEQAWARALGDLAGRLQCADRSHPSSPVTAVYGGTGVGKTSTLARLAGEGIYRHGAEKVGLITLDGYRIGAQEQLASFAEALGLPMFSVTDARGLARAVRELRGRTVFIDTAGMSQHDARLRDQYELISTLRQPVRHLLILAASSQASQCRAMATAFGRKALSGAIISKVDEAQSLGGILDVVISAALTLYGFSDGQRIPDDFHRADSDELVRRATRLVDQDKTPAFGQGLRAAG